MDVAFKCTYNNGGEDEYVGFYGTCTEPIIRSNIHNGHVLCSNPDFECWKYRESGFEGSEVSVLRSLSAKS